MAEIHISFPTQKMDAPDPIRVRLTHVSQYEAAELIDRLLFGVPTQVKKPK